MVDCPLKELMLVLNGEPDTLDLYRSPSSTIDDFVTGLLMLRFYRHRRYSATRNHLVRSGIAYILHTNMNLKRLSIRVFKKFADEIKKE